MPVVIIDLPDGLVQDATFYAQQQDIDFDSFILWAVAEKVGELKRERMDISKIHPQTAQPASPETTKDEYI